MIREAPPALARARSSPGADHPVESSGGALVASCPLSNPGIASGAPGPRVRCLLPPGSRSSCCRSLVEVGSRLCPEHVHLPQLIQRVLLQPMAQVKGVASRE